MSMTKRNPAFDRMMEEARLHDDLSHERYAEELYLNSLKGALPNEPKQVTPPKGTNTKHENGTRN